MIEPVHEVDYVRINDRLSLRDRTLARVQPFLDDLGEVIDGIKKHVIELGHFGLHIARDSKVHHEDGAVLANFDGTLQHALAEYGKRTGSASYHDIVQSQLFGKLVQRDDVSVETMSESLCTLNGAIGNSDALGIAGRKMTGA